MTLTVIFYNGLRDPYGFMFSFLPTIILYIADDRSYRKLEIGWMAFALTFKLTNDEEE